MSPPGRRAPSPARERAVARAALVGLAGKISRRPKLAHCGNCGRAVIVALEYDGIATGEKITADAMPTTPTGEILAWLARIPAFDHWGDCLTARVDYLHKFDPGNSLAVLTAHRCAYSWPVDGAAMARLYRPGARATSPDEPAPF